MDIEIKKSYVRQFVAEGVEPDQAYKLVFADDTEISEFENDADFMDGLRDTRINLAHRAIQEYRGSLSQEGKPGDHLKHLLHFFPEAFRDPKIDISKSLDLNLTINKVRGGGVAE